MAPTVAVTDPRRGRRAILYLVVAVSALAVVAADPPNVRVSVADVEAARPVWLIVAGLAALGALLSLTLVHQLSQRATGLDPSRRTLVRPTLQAQSLNMVTKSAGLAGLAAFTRHGTEQGEPRGPVVAAYLLTDVAQQLSFSVILAIALFVRWSQGGLRGTDVAAGVVFALYGSATIIVIAMAAGSREATRRVLGFPGRIRGHLMHRRPLRADRPGPAPGESSTDHRVADELHETVHLLRRSPRLILPVVGAALIPDVLFVVLLMACLRAVGSGVGLDVALVAFGVSALFGIIGFLPGGLGFVEVSLGAVLISSGVRADQAAAAIVLYRIGEFWLPVAAGVLASPGSVRYWRPVTRVATALLAAGAGVVGLVEAAGLDFLFLGMIEHFRRAGYAGMNLGLAPLALLPDDRVIDRGLNVVRRHGDSAFNFEGLYAYKNKWKPRWEPRFLAYQRGANLPVIARAVATVGELPDPASRPQRLLRFVRRWRVTLVLGGVIAWLMTLTTIDPNQQIAFERSFGLAWPDLVHLQLWRIFTGPLVQTHAGIIWSIVLLVFLIVPVAERRLGTRLTVMVFFLGDALSTLPILVTLRVAGGLGNDHALANSMGRDSGSSSGSWALAAALAATQLRGRWRTGVLAAIVAFHVGAFVLFGQLFDIQHLGAVIVGYLLAAWWTGRAHRLAASDSEVLGGYPLSASPAVRPLRGGSVVGRRSPPLSDRCPRADSVRS